MAIDDTASPSLTPTARPQGPGRPSRRRRERWPIAALALALALVSIAAVGPSLRAASGARASQPTAPRPSERTPAPRFGLLARPLDDTPTAMAPPAQPTPVGTPEPSPTWEVRELDGLFGTAFEVASFTEGDGACPDYGAGWWLGATDRAFSERYADLRSGFVPGHPYQATTYVVRARFVGRVSPPGRYGHLGQYARQVDVLQLLEMTHTDRCGRDLPDLALASMRLRRMDEAPSGCSSGVDGRAALELCIVNQGRTASSAAWIELHDEGGGVASVRVCGLAPGEAQCLAPVALPPVVTRVQIDTDDEVAERFEENNWVPLALPTLARPRPCTPLPPGRPSPTPPPTATLPPCVTPPATPTRDPRVTDAPDPTPQGIYLPVGQARQP